MYCDRNMPSKSLDSIFSWGWRLGVPISFGVGGSDLIGHFERAVSLPPDRSPRALEENAQRQPRPVVPLTGSSFVRTPFGQSDTRDDGLARNDGAPV